MKPSNINRALAPEAISLSYDAHSNASLRTNVAKLSSIFRWCKRVPISHMAGILFSQDP
jgi:hypothetical protein